MVYFLRHIQGELMCKSTDRVIMEVRAYTYRSKEHSISVSITGANLHDMKAAISTLDYDASSEASFGKSSKFI
jgi:hypothetical protein